MRFNVIGQQHALTTLGLFKTAQGTDWDTQDYLAGLGAAAVSAPLMYKGLRRFRPSSNAALRSLQERAKDLPMEIATHAPTGSAKGRGIRRFLYGASDISDAVHNAGRQGQVLKRDATVLHHGSPFSQLPVEGTVDINAPRQGLATALADKGGFADLFKQVQPQLDESIQAIPATEKMPDVLRAFGGDVEAMRKHLGASLPEGYLVKPTDESLGDVASFINETTDPRSRQFQEVLKNPNRFILQEKIPLKNEYRVHTVQGVPFTATHRRMPPGKIRDFYNSISKRMGLGEGGFAHMPVTGSRRKDLQDFVSKVNAPLGEVYKDAPMHQAFDVAELADGSFRLIESNPTPGTFNNPLLSRKMQEMVTGRMHKDKAIPLAALGGTAVGAGAGMASSALRSKEE